MSNDRTQIELITKLIFDTKSNRISWSGSGSNGGCGEYHAVYDNCYRLDFSVGFPMGTCYDLRLSEINGDQLLEITSINSLSDLHDAIRLQGGYSKVDDAIAHILNT